MNVTSPEITIDDNEPVFPEHETGAKRKLDYLGWAPCPIRTQVRQQLHAFLRKQEKLRRGETLWYMPRGCHEDNPYSDVWKTEDASELPGLVSEVGYGDMLSRPFIEKWVESGAFTPLPALPLRREFEQAGFRDPSGLRLPYSTMCYVIIADLKRLGSRPVPEHWADLLSPLYRDDLIVSGWADDLQETQLFHYHKEHGDEGLAAYGANIKDFWHPAEMVKAAGTDNPNGAALYVVPWFFAKSLFRTERARLIWPSEGALASPLYLMRRRAARCQASLALEFLSSPPFAEFLDKAGFPAASATCTQALPGALKFLGWDWILSRDLEELRPKLNAIAMRDRKK